MLRPKKLRIGLVVQMLLATLPCTRLLCSISYVFLVNVFAKYKEIVF